MPRDIEEIRRILPLRYPYLLIDRILEEGEEYVVAVKNVTIDEPFFQGHFAEPLPAVMPGTLILETMAQTAAFLLVNHERGLSYLVGVERARFRRRVVPGDQLHVRARALRRRKGLLEAKVEATVAGEVVATATLALLGERKDDE
jgi:3-hydroxyacyl-[acyl-carrier-protein] dehydratase